MRENKGAMMCGECNWPLDKESTTYFMTKMTQEEFSERTKDEAPVEYEFNKITRGEVRF